MVRLPWRKLLRDLWLNRGRTLLVVISMSVGVAGVGAIGQARTVALGGLAAAHAEANPANVILLTAPFDPALLEQVTDLPAVADVEGRFAIAGRIHPTGERPTADSPGWRPLQLFALPGDGLTRIHRVLPREGPWPPPPGEIALERASLAYLGLQVGDLVTVELGEGSIHRFRISAAAREPGRETAHLSGTSHGYISFETLRGLGLTPALNQLYVTLDPQTAAGQIRPIAVQLRHGVEAVGIPVHQTVTPPPGEHWAAPIVASISLILGRMGLLLLVMGSALVVNIILGLMHREIRQIGIMKVLGADTWQVARLYLAMALLFGLLSLAIGAPVGALAARAIMQTAVDYLNLERPALAIAPAVLGQMAAVSLAIPLLAALGPVIAASRTTVREAIGGGGGSGAFGRGPVDRVLGQVRLLSRPLLVSLRNTFRRKGRLLLTLAALSLSGAMLIAVLSLRASLELTLANSLQFRGYDLELIFDRAYPTATLEQHLGAVPGVARTEDWGLRAVRRIRPDGSESGDLVLVAPPADTALLRPVVVEGRWLRPDDDRALVVETGVLREEALAVGDRVRLRIQGQETEWEVVGLVRKPLGEPALYANRPALARVTGDPDRTVMIQVVTTHHDAAFQARVAREIQAHLGRESVGLLAAASTAALRDGTAARFRIITLFLGAMAVLMAVVAALGLAGTMSLAVLERGREIGVMRAIGASHGAIWRIVVAEGMVIGGISWLVASVLAYPISLELSRAVGQAIAQTPLDTTFSLSGVALWLGGALALTALATSLPAWNAARLTVREVLAYE